jgi:choline-sulfatase
MAPQQAAGDPDVPETWTPADVATYGFDRWDPPDAGENRDISQFGGGDADNDGRIMGSRGDGDDGEEGVLQYLRSVAPGRQPFFLVISLVDPHDVLAYPRIWQDGGYDSDPWLDGEIDLPPTVDEDLSTKPAAQRWFNTWLNLGLGPLRNAEEQRNYINFYGNLMKAADAALVEVPDTLDETGLLDDTLIVRTSDHGELGIAHGGMRQKSFNVYEESLRVRLITSLLRDEAGEPHYFIAQIEDITERKAAETALADERDLLQTLMNHLPDAIYVKDNASRFLRLNPPPAQQHPPP